MRAVIYTEREKREMVWEFIKYLQSDQRGLKKHRHGIKCGRHFGKYGFGKHHHGHGKHHHGIRHGWHRHHGPLSHRGPHGHRGPHFHRGPHSHRGPHCHHGPHSHRGPHGHRGHHGQHGPDNEPHWTEYIFDLTIDDSDSHDDAVESDRNPSPPVNETAPSTQEQDHECCPYSRYGCRGRRFGRKIIRDTRNQVAENPPADTDDKIEETQDTLTEMVENINIENAE